MTEAKPAPNLAQWQRDHLERYVSSGGTDGHMYAITPAGYGPMVVPALLLTTTGRKSGERYTFPLFYGETGNGYVIVASKGGAPDHPSWFKNLVANPRVEVQVGTKKLIAAARVATGAERESLWQTCLGFWPLYADYQKKTDREIPVVVLDPIA